MPKRYSRMQRIGDLIQTALADILQREAENMGLGIISVTGVNVSPDMSFAKIYVSVLDEEHAENILKNLNEATKSLRYELAHAVKLRVTPELRFYYDDSTLRGNRISSLINTALKDNKSENDE